MRVSKIRGGAVDIVACWNDADPASLVRFADLSPAERDEVVMINVRAGRGNCYLASSLTAWYQSRAHTHQPFTDPLDPSYHITPAEEAAIFALAPLPPPVAHAQLPDAADVDDEYTVALVDAIRRIERAVIRLYHHPELTDARHPTSARLRAVCTAIRHAREDVGDDALSELMDDAFDPVHRELYRTGPHGPQYIAQVITALFVGPQLKWALMECDNGQALARLMWSFCTTATSFRLVLERARPYFRARPHAVARAFAESFDDETVRNEEQVFQYLTAPNAQL